MEIGVGERPGIIEVPEPDITSPETLKPWVDRYVNTVSNGMKDKSTNNNPLTPEQLLKLEREQFYNMLELKEKGKPEDTIKNVLKQAAQYLYDPKKDPLNLPRSSGSLPKTPSSRKP